MRMRRLAIAIAMLLLGACGVKSQPLPPQSVRPARITDLRAKSEKAGIMLSWSRPEHLVNGSRLRKLARFQVYRASDRQPARLIGEIPVTDQLLFRQRHTFNFLDRTAALGHRYRYTVVSSTTDGYRSSPSNIAALTRVIPPPPPSPKSFAFPTPSLPR